MPDKEDNTCTYDPLAAFMEHYEGDRAASMSERTPREQQSVDQRLQQRIVDGDSIGLKDDLDEALRRHPALEIINSMLLSGMKTVGDLFGSGQMQLPFVLQSAETMKKAVSHLEPHMDHSEGSDKGIMVLATVKGDVHDIGKNLVDILLTNNGYKVINLGIKVPVETMLKAAADHRADAIGMSGLLVKSTLIMKENLELMQGRGLGIPVILGGAALTRRFVEEDLGNIYRGTLSYARNAFDGLNFMNHLHEGTPFPERRPLPDAKKAQAAPDPSATGQEKEVARRSDVSRSEQIPKVPFLGSRIQSEISLDTVFSYINETALIRGQWQLRKGKLTDEEYERQMNDDVLPTLEDLKLKMKQENILQPALVYGYFPCSSDGNDLIVYRPAGIEIADLYREWDRSSYDRSELVEWQRFSFPRQSANRHLCISDFFRSVERDAVDVCAFQIVTVGAFASEFTAGLFEQHRYKEYLYIHGLSVESAEALAEYWHRIVRHEMGIDGADARETRDLFSQGYQGSRYSFGYPACPNLEDQRQLFELLRPERIGIGLTEECHLVPEQSTSALIAHHREARYFNVR